MMRVNVKPRRRNSPRPAEKSAPAFLQWLRGRECLIAKKHDCAGKICAAHFDQWGDKGIGTKVSDRAALPLCALGHDEQHRIGWTSFQLKYQFNGFDVVERYWRAWPGRIAWEAKQDG